MSQSNNCSCSFGTKTKTIRFLHCLAKKKCNGRIRVRSEADEVMYPSFLVPTVQAYWGSVMIWG